MILTTGVRSHLHFTAATQKVEGCNIRQNFGNGSPSPGFPFGIHTVSIFAMNMGRQVFGLQKHFL